MSDVWLLDKWFSEQAGYDTLARLQIVFSDKFLGSRVCEQPNVRADVVFVIISSPAGSEMPHILSARGQFETIRTMPPRPLYRGRRRQWPWWQRSIIGDTSGKGIGACVSQ
jgi:hypothetical protein